LFIIALSIGVFIEAHFSARFRPKNKPRKLIAFSSQFNQLKEQLLNDKTIFEKQIDSIIEKKPSATKKDSFHPTFEKRG
jgi:DNA recombination protein RmuC